MSLWLKQSTAVVVSFGPALDKTDGVTEETGLVSALDHASTGIKLSKNGGALTIRHASVTATTYDAYGMYRVTLDTTDTNTVGTLRMAFNEAATCLPVWQDFMVLPANVYDSLVGGSDKLDVNMAEILGTAVATPATAGVLDVNVKNAGNTAWASGAIVAGAIATGAITNAKFAAGAIDAAAVAADAKTDIAYSVWEENIAAHAFATAGEIVNTAAYNSALIIDGGAYTGMIAAIDDLIPVIVDGVWDEARAGHVAAGSFGEGVASVAGNVDGSVGSVTGNLGGSVAGNVAGSVGSVTGNVGGNVAGNVNGSVGSVASTVQADIVTVETDTPSDYIRAAVGLATNNLDTQLDALPTAAENAAANPALSAAGVRAAVGLASANLDTQLTAIDDFLDTEIAAIYSRLGAPAGASMSADIAAVKAETALIQAKTTNLPAAPASTTNITQATGIDITKILGTAISTPATAGILDVNIVNIGGSAADLGATPGMLDVRLAEVSLGGGIQLRANLGLATADLDTQLAALPTAAEIADANWDEALSGHLTAGTTGKALSDAGAAGTPLDAAGVRTAIGMASANLDTQLGNTYNRIGAPVFGNISGDIAANYAILTNIEDSVGVGVSADVAAIKAKTDNLPADPASSTNVTAVYSRVGAPAGASVSADIAAVKAETATIQAKTTNLPAAPASTTNITAGVITTVTNLTNAPTNGDLTATMKTSVTTAATAATPTAAAVTGAVGSVTGDVGGNVVGTVASVVGAVGSLTTNNDKTGYALSAGERTTLANAILDLADGATTNYTLREALEVMLAVLAGKLSGAATATITIRDVNDTKNVVVATTDASGNRTAVTVTP